MNDDPMHYWLWAGAGFGLGFWLLGEGFIGPFVGTVAGAAVGLTLDLLVNSWREWRGGKQSDTFARWAGEHGLLYNASSPVFRDTPLLRSGDEQEGRHGFTGEFSALRGTVYEHITRYKGEQGIGPGVARHYLVLHLVFELPSITFLHIHPRSALAPHLAEALASSVLDSKEVEFESAGLSERCRIEVSERCDELRLRRLLTPRAIAVLADLCESEVFAGGLFVEAEGGKLVVATPGQIEPTKMERVEDFLAAVRPFVICLEEFSARSSSSYSGSQR